MVNLDHSNIMLCGKGLNVAEAIGLVSGSIGNNVGKGQILLISTFSVSHNLFKGPLTHGQ